VTFPTGFPGRERLPVKDGMMAKTSPGEFIRQVRAETAKVVWPTGRETSQTTIMVVIMTLILAIFFFLLDSAFSAIVQYLLGFLGR
jgi:preprotein translocase subunit SecE